MGLNDLMNEIKQDQSSFTGDEVIENKVLKKVLGLVEDKISEVKNQAVRWYQIGFHSKKAPFLTMFTAWVSSSKSCAKRRWKWWLIS
jgi:hypothetical protein